MDTRPILLGTAGHIDHGKTSLVKALTGIDCDRLKIEKERGITTELGFAHLELGNKRFGLIDVPGHERFIKAMVAGAGGLDLVILAIAADEGIMPQTREHLDICELLGVKQGVVALTKADLVDDEWIELVSQEVRTSLEGGFLEEAKIIPVSTHDERGFEALRSEIALLAKTIEPRKSDGSFRLPVDRVFTVKGFGTVVTGTVISGRIKEGDAVSVMPYDGRAKVRGIEVHGEPSDVTYAGTRAAINLAGIDFDQIHRGDVITKAEEFTPSHVIDVQFKYLSSSQAPLKRQNKVLIHHGTAQRMATLVLVDKDSLAPGESALAQIRVDNKEPFAALPGDRFIARGFVVQKHYGTTLGGGEFLRVHAPKVRRSNEENKAMIQAFAEAKGNARIALEIKTSNVNTSTLTSLQTKLGTNPKSITKAISQLIQGGDVIKAGDHYCHAETAALVEKRALDLIVSDAKKNPSKRGISKAELRNRLPKSLPLAVFEWILAQLISKGKAETLQDVVRIPGGDKAGLSPFEQKVAAQFQAWGNTPKRPKEIGAEFGVDDRKAKIAMEKLLSRGQLIKIKSDLFLHKESVSQLEKALRQHLEENDVITPGEWKTITGASRKYSIPLAEYFDQQKITLRVGDSRKKRS